MVEPEQAEPKVAFQTSIALVWAVEPAPSSWPPLPQAIWAAGAAPEAAALLPELLVELSSVPQAASDSVPTSAMAPMARALEPFRWSFTGCPFLRQTRRPDELVDGSISAGFAVVRGPFGPPVVPKVGRAGDASGGCK